MPDNSDPYYEAGADAASDDTSAHAPMKKDMEKPGDEKEAETALLPKSLFPGEPPDIGDVCDFKVEHVWEDEIEVSYVKSDKPMNDKSMKGKSSMDTATDAFDQMAATKS